MLPGQAVGYIIPPDGNDARTIHDIKLDLLRYATEVLTPQLKDPSKALCCPLCFLLCASTLHRPDSDCAQMLSDLLLHQHGFFAACLAVLAAPRASSELPALRARLADNRARCPNKRIWHCFVVLQTQMIGDPLEQLVTTVISFVGSGIRNIKAKGWFKTKARKGSWPTAPEQLFPRGGQSSVASYVFWCRALLSPFAMPFLMSLLEVARAAVIPHILASPQKDDLMQALIVMLFGEHDGPALTSTDKASLSMWMRPPYCQVDLLPQNTAAMMICTVLSGPGAKLDDFDNLRRGHERALYAALVSAVESGIISDDMDLLILGFMTEQLHEMLALPPFDVQNAINERLVSCRSRLDVPDNMPTSAQLVFTTLYRQSRSKTCSAAGCSEAGKQTCAKCKFVRYCGRACQQNDWKGSRGADSGAGIQHKTMCPFLCRLRDAGISAEILTLREFLDVYERAGIPESEYGDLISWGASSGFIRFTVA